MWQYETEVELMVFRMTTCIPLCHGPHRSLLFPPPDALYWLHDLSGPQLGVLSLFPQIRLSSLRADPAIFCYP